MPHPEKKTLILCILDILRRYSDEDHRLSQKDIADILRTEYGMSVDRKSIRRNLLGLMESGYEIEYSESIRMVPNRKTGEPEESYIWSDFYLVRDFTDSELRLLIDGLLFSKHIPYSQCKELIGKLEKLSNVYFRSRTKYIHTLPDSVPPNKQLFYTIEVLDEATAKVVVDRKAMRLWAIRYAPYVTVLMPNDLAEDIEQALRQALEQYQNSTERKMGGQI